MEAAELSDFLNLIFSCSVGIGLDLLISESSSLVVTGETSLLDTLDADDTTIGSVVSAGLTATESGSEFSHCEEAADDDNK